MTQPTPPPPPDERSGGDPQHNPPDPQRESPQPAKPRRKRRRWPWIVGAVLLVLIVLFLLAPTIASTSPVRSLILGQVNKRLNGRVQIDKWSLGWWSGTKVDGLLVFDARDRQIMQLASLNSGLTVWDLLWGHYRLGQTRIDGLDVLVSRQPDGTLNWEHLSKSKSEPSAAPQSPGSQNEKPASSGNEPAAKGKPEPTKVPDISGEVFVNSARLTYEDLSKPHDQPLFVRSLDADINIPNINDTISNKISATTQIGTGKVGSVSLNGSLAAVKSNRISTGSANVDETLKLSGVDVGALPPMLGTSIKGKLAGQSDGTVVVKLENGKSGSLNSDLALKGVSVSGPGPSEPPVLNGYDATFKNNATFSTGSSGSNLAVTLLNVSDNQHIFSLGQVANQELKMSLPASGQPAASGAIQVFADIKRLNDVLQALSGKQLAVKDQNQVVLKSGTLQGQVALAQAAGQQVQLTGNMTVADLTAASATATPLQNEKIEVAITAVANHDLSQIQVPQLQATSDILNATAKDVKLANPGGAAGSSILSHLQGGSISVAIPSLSKLQALEDAISPPTSEPPAGAGSRRQPAKSSTKIVGGSANLGLDISRSGSQLALRPSATIADLAYKSGEKTSTIQRIEMATKSPLELSGDYPSGKLFNEAVQSLAMQGELQLKAFEGQGVTIQNMDLPLVLQKGIVGVKYAGKPPGQDLPAPASFNGGALAIGGSTVDLRGKHILLNTPKNLKLVQNATLNPVFAAWSLGSYLNNPLFVGASKTTGLLNVTVVQCDRLPLDSSVTSSQDGTATFDISINGLHLGNPTLEQIAEATRINLDSFQGNVTNYQVTISKGIAHQDLTLTVGQGKRPLKESGNVRLADRQMLPVTIDLPWKLLGLKGIDKNVQAFLPEGIQIPLRGKVEQPQFSVDLNRMFQEAGQKAIEQGLLGGFKQPSATQPANENPLNQIEDLLNRGKKKKK